MQGDLDIFRKVFEASDPERCRGGVYGKSGEKWLSGPDKVDKLLYR